MHSVAASAKHLLGTALTLSPPPPTPPAPHVQHRVLRWVRQLATEQSVLQALEEAGAVPYVVAQLRLQGDPALQVGTAAAVGRSGGPARGAARPRQSTNLGHDPH